MSDTLADNWQSFAVVFGVALVLSLVLTPWTIWLSHRLGVVQEPGGRRRHQRPTGQLGGLAIVIAFVVAVLVAQFMPVGRTDDKEIIRLSGLLIGGIFIYGIGFVDDKYELGPLQLYLGQLIAGAIAIFFLIFIESFNNPLTGTVVGGWPYAVTVTITLFWLGIMMNTVNFLDGLDGLASGVTAIASLMIFIHATFQLNQVSVGLLPLALFGATLGFLVYNFYPARIFMGGGAVFLGYTLGVLSIIGGAKMATILLVMGLPLMDVAWQIVRRASQGRNPMHGDRGHLHFRLLDLGYSQRTIVMGYYFFCTMFGAIALITASRLFKLISLLVMAAILVGTFAMVSWRSSRHTHLGASIRSASDQT
ncbi:MAG: undecaprenyl/decaprenyl-phosphate alpha-N-acetylglucosaminyl 1-phosphate transferase [Chloroflexi bacterium]|nr:undecaprenyl/decaprenyl-phosphate alpha-N-acetylglucosaminyl 1-phosphate transferase [Chloroflexota bacterium]